MCIWVLILLTLLVVIIYITHTHYHECFTTIPRTINVACLYAAHNLDDEDAAFILKYSKDIPFYIIINGEWTEPCNALKNIENISIITRQNRGYDIAAWKHGMDSFKEELSKYDLLLFMNNSCIIGDDMLRLCEHASDYDLYSYGFSYELYGRPFTDPHLHAYMFFVSKALYTSDDFQCYWNSMNTTDADHNKSVRDNEYRLKSYFEQRGYKVGMYKFFDVEATYNYKCSDHCNPAIIKKREVKAYPDKLSQFKKGLMINRERGY